MSCFHVYWSKKCYTWRGLERWLIFKCFSKCSSIGSNTIIQFDFKWLNEKCKIIETFWLEFEIIRGTKDVIKRNTTNHQCTSRCPPFLVNASPPNAPPMKAQVALVTLHKYSKFDGKNC